MSYETAAFAPGDLITLRKAHPDVRVIDVRTPAEFGAGHIPGSYNVPLPGLDEHRAELTADDAGPVVLVCRSGRRADTAHAQLMAAGLHDVHVLSGGVVAWERAGQPLQQAQGAPSWAIERQVRGVAGAVVTTSVLVSVVWPPARFVAGALGAGLLFAALTDTCAMGDLLARLPYNRRRGDVGCDLPAVVSHLTASTTPPTSERQP